MLILRKLSVVSTSVEAKWERGVIWSSVRSLLFLGFVQISWTCGTWPENDQDQTTVGKDGEIANTLAMEVKHILISEKKVHFKYGWSWKKYTNKAGMRKPQNLTPLQNDAVPLSGLKHNALAFLVQFVTYTTKRTRDASALRWRPEKGTASFCSGVGFLRFSHPRLVCILFQLHPYSKWRFFRNFFPRFCFFWGGGGEFRNQFSPQNMISHCRRMRHH